MPNEIDRSNEALLARRQIAEKAAQESGENIFIDCIRHKDANTPDVVMAHIDEIIRLRAEVERLDREADWLAQQFQNCPDEVEPEGEYWDICKMEDCAGLGKEDVAACWRRAASKRAVEKKL